MIRYTKVMQFGNCLIIKTHGGITMKKLLSKLLSGALAAFIAVTALPAVVYADSMEYPEPDEITFLEPVSEYEFESELVMPGDDLLDECYEISDKEAAEYVEEWCAERERHIDEVPADAALVSRYDTSTKYFYDQLTNEAEKSLYNDCLAALEEFYWSNEEPVMSESGTAYTFGLIYYDKSQMDLTRAWQIADMVIRSNPKFFFQRSFWGNESLGYVFYGVSEDFITRAEINRCRDAIEQITEEWIPEITSHTEDIDRELAIVSKIVDHVDAYDKLPRLDKDGKKQYDEKGELIYTFNNQKIAGCFVDKVCVCAGFAEATQYLCHAAGLDCLSISSVPKGNHRFVFIKLYGNWYCLDTAWIWEHADNKLKSEFIGKRSDYIDTSGDYCFNSSLATFKEKAGSKADCHTPNAFYTEDWKIELPDCVSDFVFDESRTCIVTFSGEGIPDTEQTVTWGTAPAKPASPTKKGYRFGGWYADSGFTKPFTFDFPVYTDMTVYARMVKISESDAGLTISEGKLTEYSGNGGKVIIPADVREIDIQTFVKSKSDTITSFDVDSGNTFFTAIDGIIYTKDRKTLVMFPRAREEETYTLPAGTETLGPDSLRAVLKVRNIIIPDSVTSIGARAFFAVKNMNTVSIPDSVKSIAIQAFSYAYSFTGSMTIPASVKSLSTYIFYASTGLTDIVINAEIPTLRKGMFKGCTGLKTVGIPGTITKMEEETFTGCTSLTDLYFDGTSAQWKKVDRSKSSLPDSCTIHCGPFENVVATFGGKTVTAADLTALGKDKAFKNATGAVEIIICKDLTTTPQVFSFPSKATSVALIALTKHTVLLKSASLSTKGDLTLSNIALTTAKGSVGLTVKGSFTAENSTFGKASLSGSSTITNCTAGAVTVSGKKGETVFVGTNSTGSLTISNNLKVTGALTVVGKFTPKGDMDIDAKITLRSK